MQKKIRYDAGLAGLSILQLKRRFFQGRFLRLPVLNFTIRYSADSVAVLTWSGFRKVQKKIRYDAG
ncbi:hypothetical protein, partial [Salmonella enterica]|uniref:hypothetical protein n=1 Tax=Salmonella enterica TaxID=28901 RepID=UPI0026296C08